ncbi:MAG: hypothetical protein A2787_05690 [Omnitrophica WOR_2 bacterium RIFCSPHIGHO2_01_FULL_48_9]|nr:MAG: hypothetical protein A3D10_08885 [Omnitrophica WOR_2 bacterium RIFCSPHIGHO2_02_FULL_48_11]OGX30642.1 MAG: hypothetical protein A2787_05690 [Omnitrophica WOR_2 bacterium RIFCSPHIGHO2_01_FULL_48_9]
MQKFRITTGILSGLIFSALWVFQAQAADFAKSTQFLVDQGKKHYQDGNFPSALHEFSKALLVDPKNETAMDYLGKMGFQDGLYGRRPSPVTRSAMLSQDVKVLRDKWSDSEREKALVTQDLSDTEEARHTLCLLLEKKRQQYNHLNHKLAYARENFQQENIEVRKHLQDLESQTALQEEEIVFLEKFTDKHKRLVNEKDKVLSHKDRELKDLKDQIHLVKAVSLDDSFNAQDRLLKQSGKYKAAVKGLNAQVKYLKEENQEKATELAQAKDQLVEMQLAYVPKIGEPGQEAALPEPAASILEEKIRLLKQRDQDIAQLKEKLVAANQKIQTLQKDPQSVHAPEIASLKEQIQEMRQQLSEKTQSLEEEGNDLAVLKERLGDAREQLGIVKTIVGEKEAEIKDLQNQISQVRSQCK